MALIGSTQQNAGPGKPGMFQVMAKVYLQSFMELDKLLHQSGFFLVLAEFLVHTNVKVTQIILKKERAIKHIKFQFIFQILKAKKYQKKKNNKQACLRIEKDKSWVVLS